MPKKFFAILVTSLLFLVLIFSAVNQSSFTVNAIEANANWHSSEGWPQDWNQIWPDEVTVSDDVVYYIFLKFNSLNYEWKMFSDQYTTAANIYDVASAMADYDYAAVFLYSHGAYYNAYGSDITDFGTYQDPNPIRHYYSFMGPSSGSSDDLYDSDLGLLLNIDAGHHFVFMWECGSAQQQGYNDYEEWRYDPNYGWYYYTGTGPVGWAYFWTGWQSLTSDGYGSPDQSAYAFIGFYDFSPPLTAGTGYSSYTYADFVEAFYDKALDTNDRTPINQTLDYSAQQTFGASYHFSETSLYNGWWAYVPPPANESRWTSMRVFGNGNNYLSIG